MPPRDLKPENVSLDEVLVELPSVESEEALAALDTAQRIGWPTPDGAWLE